MSNVIRIDALYFRRKRERTTAQLRAEVLDETITMAWLCEFVAELSALEPVNDAVFVGWD